MMFKKILNLTHGFIEPIGSGSLKRHHAATIKEGTAVPLPEAYRRLKRALEADDGLMSACIKEAVKRGHKIG